MQNPVNCEMSGCQDDPIRIAPLFRGKVCTCQWVLVFLVNFFRPFALDKHNIKWSKKTKGETQCFAKESSGHLHVLRLHFVLIENGKTFLGKRSAFCKQYFSLRDTSVFYILTCVTVGFAVRNIRSRYHGWFLVFGLAVAVISLE